MFISELERKLMTNLGYKLKYKNSTVPAQRQTVWALDQYEIPLGEPAKLIERLKIEDIIHAL